MAVYRARLVRGRIYKVFGKTFEGGGPAHVITQEQKDHLEQNATEVLTIFDGERVGGHVVQKFAFEEIVETSADPDDGNEAEDETPKPAARGRRKPKQEG